jgi:hypothetical protein
MFPEWNFNVEDRQKFDKLVHILEKHEGRDPKTDVGFLKTEILSKWSALSNEMKHADAHVHDELNDADLTELAKVVTYKFVDKGKEIKPDSGSGSDDKKREIYIILKGSVRLAYPMNELDNPKFSATSLSKAIGHKLGFWPSSKNSVASLNSPGGLSRKLTIIGGSKKKMTYAQL